MFSVGVVARLVMRLLAAVDPTAAGCSATTAS
jgi:hypothetical protein